MNINTFDTISIMEFTLMGVEKLGQEIGKRTVKLHEMKKKLDDPEYTLDVWSKITRLENEIDSLSVIYSYVSTHKS